MLFPFNRVKNKIVPKTNEVHLPDDSKARFYYDQNLKRWIDTEQDNNDEQHQVEDKKRQGPPKLPMMISQSQELPSAAQQRPPPSMTQASQLTNSIAPQTTLNSNQYSFTRSKQKQRYVDIFHQN